MSEIEHRKIRRLLVANRSEIAIRVMRAAAELGIGNVAVYSEEDRFALHRFKADQSYRIGEPGKPIAAYLDIDEMLRVGKAGLLAGAESVARVSELHAQDVGVAAAAADGRVDQHHDRVPLGQMVVHLLEGPVG